jgi:RNA polymerase sigma factor (TIGR02999 family)
MPETVGSGAAGRMQQYNDETQSEGALWAELYPELKQLARSRLRRSGAGRLLDTTGLVNESYLRVAGAGAKCEASRGQFMAYAARTMRSVVVDLIREGQAQRRGGDLQRVTLNTAVMDAALAADEPLTIDEALKALATVEPRLCQVVEMRYFAGLTEEEIGAALGVTERTVRRDWTKARLLLRSMLQDD